MPIRDAATSLFGDEGGGGVTTPVKEQNTTQSYDES